MQEGTPIMPALEFRQEGCGRRLTPHGQPGRLQKSRRFAVGKYTRWVSEIEVGSHQSYLHSIKSATKALMFNISQCKCSLLFSFWDREYADFDLCVSLRRSMTFERSDSGFPAFRAVSREAEPLQTPAPLYFARLGCFQHFSYSLRFTARSKSRPTSPPIS